MTRDEVFVPRTLAERKVKANPKKVEVAPGVHLDELLEDAPIYRLGWLVIQQVRLDLFSFPLLSSAYVLITLPRIQLFGWPAYLFTNASGQAWYPSWTNHFDPKSLIFDARHRSDVLISDAFLIGMFTLLTLFGQKMGGFGEVVKYYGIPYLAVNHWLVMITYLQHTDPQLPHYRADQWNFVRGALCTIDRNLLGPVGPYLMHGITETREFLPTYLSALSVVLANCSVSSRRHRSPPQQQDPSPQRLEGASPFPPLSLSSTSC